MYALALVEHPALTLLASSLPTLKKPRLGSKSSLLFLFLRLFHFNWRAKHLVAPTTGDRTLGPRPISPLQALARSLAFHLCRGKFNAGAVFLFQER